MRLTDDDGGSGYNFSIEVVGADAGTWCVEVRGFPALTGPYRLHVLPVDGALGAAQAVLPLVTAASTTQQQGFVRVFNRSNRSGHVRIDAIDDTGRRFGPILLWLDAGASKNFNSRDLEEANPSVGLYGGVGDGTGRWRVELRADYEVEAGAYIRTPDGFLTSMHQVAEETAPGSLRYYVPFFNPGSNRSQVSLLRLINPGTDAARVVVSGVDSKGDAGPQGDVRLSLPGGNAVLLSAQQLEQGGAGLQGRLGDGAGKWQLHVDSDRPLRVMGLMQTRSGHLSNLSR